MADIDIERKQPGIGPWIVAIALVVLAVAWLNWDRDRFSEGDVGVITSPADGTPTDATRVDDTAVALPSAVASFVQFVESPQRVAVGLDHAYVSTAIER